MKKTKTEDLYDKDKEVEKEEEEEETTDIVKEDIAPEAPEAVKTPEAPKLDMEEIKNLLKDMVKEGLDEITKDFRANQKETEDKKASELNDLLQDEPYGYSKEYLEGRSLSKLNDLKEIVENSKVYKDFQKSKEPAKIHEDIDKEIFNAEDLTMSANDPWKKYKQDFGGDKK